MADFIDSLPVLASFENGAKYSGPDFSIRSTSPTAKTTHTIQAGAKSIDLDYFIPNRSLCAALRITFSSTFALKGDPMSPTATQNSSTTINSEDELEATNIPLSPKKIESTEMLSMDSDVQIKCKESGSENISKICQLRSWLNLSADVFDGEFIYQPELKLINDIDRPIHSGFENTFSDEGRPKFRLKNPPQFRERKEKIENDDINSLQFRINHLSHFHEKLYSPEEINSNVSEMGNNEKQDMGIETVMVIQITAVAEKLCVHFQLADVSEEADSFNLKRVVIMGFSLENPPDSRCALPLINLAHYLKTSGNFIDASKAFVLCSLSQIGRSLQSIEFLHLSKQMLDIASISELQLREKDHLSYLKQVIDISDGNKSEKLGEIVKFSRYIQIELYIATVHLENGKDTQARIHICYAVLYWRILLNYAQKIKEKNESSRISYPNETIVKLKGKNNNSVSSMDKLPRLFPNIPIFSPKMVEPSQSLIDGMKKLEIVLSDELNCLPSSIHCIIPEIISVYSLLLGSSSIHIRALAIRGFQFLVDDNGTGIIDNMDEVVTKLALYLNISIMDSIKTRIFGARLDELLKSIQETIGSGSINGVLRLLCSFNNENRTKISLTIGNCLVYWVQILCYSKIFQEFPEVPTVLRLNYSIPYLVSTFESVMSTIYSSSLESLNQEMDEEIEHSGSLSLEQSLKEFGITVSVDVMNNNSIQKLWLQILWRLTSEPLYVPTVFQWAIHYFKIILEKDKNDIGDISLAKNVYKLGFVMDVFERALLRVKSIYHKKNGKNLGIRSSHYEGPWLDRQLLPAILDSVRWMLQLMEHEIVSFRDNIQSQWNKNLSLLVRCVPNENKSTLWLHFRDALIHFRDAARVRNPTFQAQRAIFSIVQIIKPWMENFFPIISEIIVALCEWIPHNPSDELFYFLALVVPKTMSFLGKFNFHLLLHNLLDPFTIRAESFEYCLKKLCTAIVSTRVADCPEENEFSNSYPFLSWSIAELLELPVASFENKGDSKLIKLHQRRYVDTLLFTESLIRHCGMEHVAISKRTLQHSFLSSSLKTESQLSPLQFHFWRVLELCSIIIKFPSIKMAEISHSLGEKFIELVITSLTDNDISVDLLFSVLLKHDQNIACISDFKGTRCNWKEVIILAESMKFHLLCMRTHVSFEPILLNSVIDYLLIGQKLLKILPTPSEILKLSVSESSIGKLLLAKLFPPELWLVCLELIHHPAEKVEPLSEKMISLLLSEKIVCLQNWIQKQYQDTRSLTLFRQLLVECIKHPMDNICVMGLHWLKELLSISNGSIGPSTWFYDGKITAEVLSLSDTIQPSIIHIYSSIILRYMGLATSTIEGIENEMILPDFTTKNNGEDVLDFFRHNYSWRKAISIQAEEEKNEASSDEEDIDKQQPSPKNEPETNPFGISNKVAERNNLFPLVMPRYDVTFQECVNNSLPSSNYYQFVIDKYEVGPLRYAEYNGDEEVEGEELGIRDSEKDWAWDI